MRAGEYSWLAASGFFVRGLEDAVSKDTSGREDSRDQPAQTWLDPDRREFIGGSVAAIALAGAAAAASTLVIDVSKPGRVGGLCRRCRA